jgi:hypothetical protein
LLGVVLWCGLRQGRLSFFKFGRKSRVLRQLERACANLKEPQTSICHLKTSEK